MVPASDNGAAAVAAAARLGFDANPLHRRSPLHAAVARGDRDCVVALIAAGADLDAKDPQFNATPLDWARFLSKPELVEYLDTNLTH
jgi:ankyrin repeat protein